MDVLVKALAWLVKKNYVLDHCISIIMYMLVSFDRNNNYIHIIM